MRVTTPALAFLFFWLPLAAFSFKDTPIGLLRAEAGWYQNLAHASTQEQENLRHMFLTTSLKGHYLPFGFWADFRYTKWAGMREPVMRARQVVAVALLATTLFSLILLLGRIWELSTATRTGIAGGLTAVYLFQPHMIEVVSWPIMILQLAWLIFTGLTLFALTKLVTSDCKARWAWLTTLFAYTSLHAFGLGLATVWAAAALLFVIWLAGVRGTLPSWRTTNLNIGLALGVLIVVSTLHALVMLRPGLDTTPPPMLHPTGGIWPVLGLIAFYPFLLAANLFVRVSLEVSIIERLSEAWWEGAIVLFFGIALFVRLGRTAVQRETSIALTRFVLFGFSIFAFLGYILLIAVRQTRELGEQAFLEFLNGPSYIVTVGFTLVGAGLAVILPVARRAPIIATILIVGLGLGSFVVHQNYQRNIYPKVVPYAGISHVQAWQAIVAMARESHAANLPIPNVPMQPVAQFGGWTLEKYEYMLHDELHLAPEERCQFIDWEKCRGEDWPRYESAAPSLSKVITLLHLDGEPRQ